jgi:hypothetical protein
VRLLPGEWPPRGDERALLAVLDGHIEVAELFDASLG